MYDGGIVEIDGVLGVKNVEMRCTRPSALYMALCKIVPWYECAMGSPSEEMMVIIAQ